jgi:hypothetical protein
MTSSDLSGRSVVAVRDHGAGHGRAAQLARHVGLTSGMGVETAVGLCASRSNQGLWLRMLRPLNGGM